MNRYGIDLVVHGFASEEDSQKQSMFFDAPIKLGKFLEIPYTNGVSTTDRITKLRSINAPTKTKWFGSCISETTNESSTIPFHPFPLKLRVVVEPHLCKALKRQTELLGATRLATGQETFDGVISKFCSIPLLTEGEFNYDVVDYDLKQSLLIFLKDNHHGIELELLHAHFQKMRFSAHLFPHISNFNKYSMSLFGLFAYPRLLLYVKKKRPPFIINHFLACESSNQANLALVHMQM